MTSLSDWVIERYAVLMTPTEAAAHARLLLTRRATYGDTSAQAQAQVTSSTINQRQYPEACAADPAVIELARDGIEAFVQRTAARILREFSDELDLPRCGTCRAVLDPPTSSRCAACARGGSEAAAAASA